MTVFEDIFDELFNEFQKEKPPHPLGYQDVYEIGYSNGLNMAQGIVLKFKKKYEEGEL